MYTKLALPDGSVTYPGINLKPPVIMVDELEFGDIGNLAQRMKDLGSRYYDDSFFRNEAIPAVPGRIDVAEGNEAAAKGKQHGKTRRRGKESSYNFNSHRTGVLVTFDPRNLHLLDPKNSPFQGEKSVLLDRYRTLSGGNKSKEAVVGNKHCEQLIKNDVTGGLTFLYLHTKEDPNMFIEGRAQFLRWIPAKSPILIRALQICQEYVRGMGERVLIFVDTPWIQA